MTKDEFPIHRADVHYDASSDEVTLKREKFEAFVKYAQTLLQRLEDAEDAADVQRYRTRRAQQTSDVLQALNEDILQATAAVREWLEGQDHTISELSSRTGIPYATCHRIINERLGTPNIEIGHLEKMAKAVSAGVFQRRRKAPTHFHRVLLAVPKGFPQQPLQQALGTPGTTVTTVHAGTEIAGQINKLRPDLVLLDVAIPSIRKNVFEVLGKLAKDRKSTIILTSEPAETTSALIQTISEGEEQADSPETETAGG